MSRFAIILLAAMLCGCVINFKSERPTRGIIHVDVQYAYPGKCEMNSIEGYYKKELSKGHYAQTKIALDPGQQLLILDKALVLHFFQMPQTFTHAASAGSSDDTHYLRIHADSLDSRVTWMGPTASLKPEKYRLDQLVSYIDSIVRSTDDYQGLPASTSPE